MLKIGIILGSTRPGRNGEAVAKWVYEIAQKRTDAEFELVDIKDFNLPLLDEPVPPSMGQYSKPHTKAWAAKIGSFDGYVFVTPEYNHGISGALKNAIDFLFGEWNNKAAGFVSYGGAGGARAVEQLRLVLAGRGANRHGAQPGSAFVIYRLRKLQRLQAGRRARELGQRGVRPGHRLGRRIEAVSRKTDIGSRCLSQNDPFHLAQEFLGRMGSGAEPAEIARLFSKNWDSFRRIRGWRGVARN
jgi:NAD(P)H-dependent FMN reductase